MRDYVPCTLPCASAQRHDRASARSVAAGLFGVIKFEFVYIGAACTPLKPESDRPSGPCPIGPGAPPRSLASGSPEITVSCPK